MQQTELITMKILKSVFLTPRDRYGLCWIGLLWNKMIAQLGIPYTKNMQLSTVLSVRRQNKYLTKQHKNFLALHERLVLEICFFFGQMESNHRKERWSSGLRNCLKMSRVVCPRQHPKGQSMGSCAKSCSRGSQVPLSDNDDHQIARLNSTRPEQEIVQ